MNRTRRYFLEVCRIALALSEKRQRPNFTGDGSRSGHLIENESIRNRYWDLSNRLLAGKEGEFVSSN
jgi:hypothetical protein